MKKFILLAAISSTFIMCKKSEAAQSQFEKAVHTADSAASNTSETIHSINKTAEEILDSSNIKIKDLENAKEDIKSTIENTSKIADSLTNKIASVKLELKTEKKDAAEKKSKKIAVSTPAQKVIKETKIIYKDHPRKDNYELNISKNKMVKTGVLELNVPDAETAKEIVKEQVKKYDGYIRSENISFNNNDQKISYLKIKVPIQKFDYLMDDLSNNIGEIENKGVDVSGQDYVNNTLCDLEITLYGAAGEYTAKDKPKTFGEKSLAAVSSGWEVITSIFLFILPLWPLLLIAGIGYYFYKKKNKNLPNNDSH
ncbi:hypothetical protein M2347_002801 [Chryseobacterium sp. H1D6B]|uniref:DUF4349 domain-containing protein n=1 Tax=Chryseobacterium sp. H1D6B TaxID=2940588 RepID=UPI0015C8CF46|nr:DUF4349 domain-containing protein [Chryseobacterium sp. H1D6B]MDH6253074.1 hypothetical protein [Chryseobacterium sp. H1D6B]